jgi:hypothetical protein
MILMWPSKCSPRQGKQHILRVSSELFLGDSRGANRKHRSPINHISIRGISTDRPILRHGWNTYVVDVSEAEAARGLRSFTIQGRT